MSKKHNILFLGAFNLKNYKNVKGGILYACSTIMQSDLVNKYNFIKIDSTQRSIPPPNILIRIYDSICRIFTLLKNLYSNRIDLFFVFTSDGLGFIEKGLMILIVKFFKIKTVVYPVSGFILENVKNKFFRIFLKLILNKTDVLLVQGESWKFFFQEYSSKKTKILIQQNWIDTSKYSYINKKFDNKLINILFLGWVDEKKGVFDLVDVFDKLINEEKLINIRLVIAGNGSDFNKLKIKIKNLCLENHIDLLGWIDGDKKLKILKESDIYVHPSYFEGQPYSLIEAMSFGIPSIVTNVGSIPDVIKSGKNGLIFSPGNKVSLKNHLLNLINNKNMRIKFSNNSVNSVRKNNSIISCVKNLDNIFKQTINS